METDNSNMTGESVSPNLSDTNNEENVNGNVTPPEATQQQDVEGMHNYTFTLSPNSWRVRRLSTIFMTHMRLQKESWTRKVRMKKGNMFHVWQYIRVPCATR